MGVESSAPYNKLHTDFMVWICVALSYTYFRLGLDSSSHGIIGKDGERFYVGQARSHSQKRNFIGTSLDDETVYITPKTVGSSCYSVKAPENACISIHGIPCPGMASVSRVFTEVQPRRMPALPGHGIGTPEWRQAGISWLLPIQEGKKIIYMATCRYLLWKSRLKTKYRNSHIVETTI